MLQKKKCFWIVFEQLLTFLESLKELVLCLKNKSIFLKNGVLVSSSQFIPQYYFLGLPLIYGKLQIKLQYNWLTSKLLICYLYKRHGKRFLSPFHTTSASHLPLNHHSYRNITK